MTTAPQRVLALAGISTVVLMIAACSSPQTPAASDSASGAADAPISIAYAGISDSDPLFRSVGIGLKELGEAAGGTVTTFDNNFDATTALANTRLMIQQKPDVIMQWAPQAATESIGKLIEQSGIPCIAINIAIPGCAFFNLSNALIGDQAGTAAAAAAKENGWTADDMTVALISIAIGGEEGHSSVTHFYSTFAAEFPEMQQAKPEDITLSTTEIGDLNAVQVDSVGSLDSAYAAMQKALQIIPNDRNLVVQTQNDDSARGALRAIEQAGRQDATIIVSTGADEAALGELRDNPAWVAEGDPSVALWPKYLLAMGHAVVDGVETPELTLVPQVTLTKENIDDYYDGTTPLLNNPVPAEDAYLEPYLAE